MAKQGSSYKWIVLFVLVFGSAILNYSNMIFASRPVDVMAQYHMTQAQLTALSTIGLLPGALFSIVLGRFFDKHGGKTIRYVGAVMLLLGAGCQLWRVFASSYIEVFVLTFLLGTFFLPTQVLPPKIIGAWFDRAENATAMGVFGSAAGMGITLTFAVGNLFPTTTIALMSCVAGFAAAAALWVAIVKMPSGFDQPPADSAAVAAQDNISVKAVLTSKTMLLVMFCAAFAAGAPLFLNSYLMNAFIDKGMDIGAASLLGVVLNISLVCGAIAIGFVSSKAGKFNKLYLLTGAVGGLFFLLTYLVPLGPLTYVCIAIAGLFSSGSLSLNMGRIALIPLTGDFGPENIGIAGGMNNTAMGIGMFGIPIIAALIVGTNYLAVFITVLIIFVITGLVGGFAIPELGEKGELAQAAQRNAQR